MRSKPERNKKVVELLEAGYSYSSVAEKFGFKSKGTVYGIYKRNKAKV